MDQQQPTAEPERGVDGHRDRPAHDFPPGDAPWLGEDRSHWDRSVHLWLEQVAQPNSFGSILGVTEIKARPWSIVLRVTFERTTVYFKACGSGGRYEPGLLVYLAEVWPQYVPALVAVDHFRSWIVMKDEGSPLRDGTDARLQIGVLNRLLPVYAEMQLASRHSVDDLIRLGLPDRRLGLLPDLVEHLVSGDALGFGRTVQNAERLKDSVRRLRPCLMRGCTILAESPYGSALDHGDLHTANILLNGDHHCLCDWGDACVTHPFCSIGVTIETALRFVPEADRQEAKAQILASYLEPWTALASPATAQSEMQMALWLAHVLRALDFARMFGGEDEESRDRWKPLIGEKLREWVSLPIPVPCSDSDARAGPKRTGPAGNAPPTG